MIDDEGHPIVGTYKNKPNKRRSACYQIFKLNLQSYSSDLASVHSAPTIPLWITCCPWENVIS